MKYINDLSPPVIVLTGTLNPAIFNTLWVATNIFDYEEGAVLNFHQAVYQLGDELRQLTVLDGVGWSVTQNRCEIFITSLEPEILGRAENFAISIVQTLPHTPWGSAGINFQFYAQGDVDDLLEKYQTPEGFEAGFNIGNQSLSVALMIDPNLTLNVQRNVGDDFSILFNNHNSDLNAENAADLLQGAIKASLDRSRDIMAKQFEMDEEEQRFLNPQEGEVANVL